MCEIIINELIEELFNENQRLINELKFSLKCNAFLEKYRSVLLSVFIDSYNNKVLIESLESQYKTIITDGCAQHSTQTITTHNWPLDTQTTPVGHRSETITTEDQSMTGEDIVNDKLIETYTGSDGCVENTIDETIHPINENEVKVENEDTVWDPLLVMKYSTYNKPKRQRVQTARKSCVSTVTKTSKVYQSETSPSVSAPPKTSLYVFDYYGCVETFTAKSLLEDHRRLKHKEFSIKSNNKLKPIEIRTLKPFACDYDNCKFRAVNQPILDSHRENHERDGQQFICDYDDCRRTFAHESALKIHQHRRGHFDDTDVMAIPGPPYGCQWPDCAKTFKNISHLKRHMDQVHTGVRPFGCHDCPRRFLSNSELCLHRRQKHSLEPFVPKKDFKCDYNDCQFETISLSALSYHKKRHFNIREFVCEETDCGMGFVTKADLKKHMRSHSDERPHRCDWPACQMAFKTINTLATHRSRHTGDMKLHCDVSGCSYGTNHRLDFEAHQLKHQNIRPFVCEETDCGKDFGSKRGLKKHMLSHSDERPYRCDWPGCESAYKSPQVLDDHRRTHTNDRKYKCSFAGCGKCFTRNSTLQTHINSHKHPFVCHWPACDHTFAYNWSLKAHMNEHQGIRPHKCHSSGCNKSFFSKPSLRQHLRVVHKIVLS